MTISETWNPPSNPDPHAIFHETYDDVRESRHAIALAKLVWFHEHALTYEKSLSGVRLSFALGSWHELAKIYAPAMEALRQARDNAELRFHESGFEFHAFHDFMALNRTLGENDRTAISFKVVDRTNPEAASRLYHVAQPSLIRQAEFALCGKYLEPESKLGLAILAHDIERRLEREEILTRPDFPQAATKTFVRRMGTLVALLVKNGRDDDAQWVVRTALAKVDCESFRLDLDDALAGNIPPQ